MADFYARLVARIYGSGHHRFNDLVVLFAGDRSYPISGIWLFRDDGTMIY